MSNTIDDLLVDLAAARLGGRVVAANDDFFAEKENLVADRDPLWDPDRYTDRGKWMDGWETRRRRQPGYDWAIVRLGVAGIVHRVLVDTSHFTGNYPESCSLDIATLPGDPADGAPGATEWSEAIPRTVLQGDSRVVVPLPHPTVGTHVRLNIHPDGGVARLRVFGDPVPPDGVLDGSRCDLAALANGGRAVDCSNRHYSSPNRMLVTGSALGMWDGWETRRRRGPGNDWATIRLAGRGEIETVEIDTNHFKGNAPGSAAVFGADVPGVETPGAESWMPVLAGTELSPDTPHRFDDLASTGPFTHLRLDIHPDGGVARFRAWGRSTTPWTSPR
ncbi:MAG TPA: allantoicase [Acidimicrobiia bacterium]|nr:allantoicase [Acidimicrobiia bacterium]